MRLLTFIDSSGQRAGVLVDGQVYAVDQLFSAETGRTVKELLGHGLDRTRDWIGEHGSSLDPGHRSHVGRPEEITLAAPITDPGKIIGVGLNYSKHIAETGRDRPEYPVFFAKFANSLTGHAQTVPLPDASTEIDFEGELAVVIGMDVKRASETEAMESVAGFTVVNDVTARDLQYRTHQWLQGKAIDGFLPCGPTLVTRDEAGDVSDLLIKTTVNGKAMQDASTSEMIFDVPALISSISEAMTLSPGDLILTGTPGGIGSKRTPPVWIGQGDTVSVEIEGIGTLTNRFSSPS